MSKPKMIMYKNTRSFGGKLFDYEGTVFNMTFALKAMKEMKRVNKNYAFRAVKVRDGYRIFSRKMRAY